MWRGKTRSLIFDYLVLIGVYLRLSAAILFFFLARTAFAASIAVDVGHYLEKPGVISARGVSEFDYNLRLAREISEALQACLPE